MDAVGGPVPACGKPRRARMMEGAILPMNLWLCANPLESGFYLIGTLRPAPDGENMTHPAPPVLELDAKDLPPHCPNPGMPQWSSHPLVYLKFDHDGTATCPYCGNAYRLKPGVTSAHH